jgi:hypothetical protein
MPARPITIWAILQIFLIVACFLTVGFFMKMLGYPDGRPWPLGPACDEWTSAICLEPQDAEAGEEIVRIGEALRA